MPTNYPIQEVNSAKADSWLESAKQQTQGWLDSFGYGNGPKAVAVEKPPSIDIKLPTAEELFAAAPWRDLDPPKPAAQPQQNGTAPAPAAASAPGQAASSAAPAAPGVPGGQSGADAPLAAVDTSSREANLRSWAPALQAAERRGFRADALAAIIIAENGGGQSPLSAKDNNYFSISAVGRPHQAGAGTGGRFARYNTPQDSLDDFLDLIERDPRYAKAYAARGNPDQFFRELIAAGYIAEEPGYPVDRWLVNLHDGREQYQRIVPPGSQQQTPTAAPQAAPQQPGGQGSPAWNQNSGDYTPLTPDQSTLADPDKWSLCGPVAAVAMARARGGNWSVEEAKALAQKHGLWNAERGMGGLETEATLLRKMGYAAKTGGADWQAIQKDVTSGNPVTLSTRWIPEGHYVVLERYDPQTGRYYVGGAGRTLVKTTNMSPWMTVEQIMNLGPVEGALFFDNPGSLQASVANEPEPATVAQQQQAEPTMYRAPLGGDDESPEPQPVKQQRLIAPIDEQGNTRDIFDPPPPPPHRDFNGLEDDGQNPDVWVRSPEGSMHRRPRAFADNLPPGWTRAPRTEATVTIRTPDGSHFRVPRSLIGSGEGQWPPEFVVPDSEAPNADRLYGPKPQPSQNPRRTTEPIMPVWPGYDRESGATQSPLPGSGHPDAVPADVNVPIPGYQYTPGDWAPDFRPIYPNPPQAPGRQSSQQTRVFDAFARANGGAQPTPEEVQQMRMLGLLG